MNATASRKYLWQDAGTFFYLIEKFGLSLLYFYFAWIEARQFEFHTLVANHGSPIWSKIFVEDVRHLILFLLQSVIGLSLLFGRKPASSPRKLAEVLVPLAASFFFLAYQTLDRYQHHLIVRPGWLRILLPPEERLRCAAIALQLGFIGPAIAAWGAFYLGRSFGIFVSVREVVVRGPYRFVRHPMYLGYGFIWAAYALVNLSIAVLVLIAIHALIFVWRARLEEARLAEASPAYGEYMKRTGAIFPKLWGTR